MYSGGTPVFVEDNIFEIVILMGNVAGLQVGSNKTDKETNKETSVNGIAEILEISVGGVRYHINKMKKAGLIEHTGSTKKGKWIVYK